MLILVACPVLVAECFCHPVRWTDERDLGVQVLLASARSCLSMYTVAGLGFDVCIHLPAAVAKLLWFSAVSAPSPDVANLAALSFTGAAVEG